MAMCVSGQSKNEINMYRSMNTATILSARKFIRLLGDDCALAEFCFRRGGSVTRPLHEAADTFVGSNRIVMCCFGRVMDPPLRRRCKTDLIVGGVGG